jgi:hypothetical protein
MYFSFGGMIVVSAIVIIIDVYTVRAMDQSSTLIHKEQRKQIAAAAAANKKKAGSETTIWGLLKGGAHKTQPTSLASFALDTHALAKTGGDADDSVESGVRQKATRFAVDSDDSDDSGDEEDEAPR